MIHKVMKTASIRDLRTRFPEVRKLLEQQGEIVVTDRGKPVMVLRAYHSRQAGRRATVDYYERLRGRMPSRIASHDRERCRRRICRASVAHHRCGEPKFSPSDLPIFL
jgi:antitoxin (DNA-binding transcriptional repressor) of toxin-antitoxin stability system